MMNAANTIPIDAQLEPPWVLPSRGTVGMACLIVAEAAIFIIFFVSYVFYLGKSLTSAPSASSPAASPFISRSAPCAGTTSAIAPSV
jgi:cytochrome c oxidase subunit 3/cytochrome o ubiquinol oxidase subunit 3